ncbi:hypothetical protein HY448_02060 [Candidatus Pacearchaeota archaeon]|nr:hypothetical protein [Candidatus Pacearchaeota archaeon]
MIDLLRKLSGTSKIGLSLAVVGTISLFSNIGYDAFREYTNQYKKLPQVAEYLQAIEEFNLLNSELQNKRLDSDYLERLKNVTEVARSVIRTENTTEVLNYREFASKSRKIYLSGIGLGFLMLIAGGGLFVAGFPNQNRDTNPTNSSRKISTT